MPDKKGLGHGKIWVVVCSCSLCDVKIRDTTQGERVEVVIVELREPDPRDLCRIRQAGLLVVDV